MGLERMRWVQQDVQDEMVLVNIAGFQQYLVRNDTVVFQSRIMVGQPYRKTPIFRDNIEYLVLNPTWTVPPTILTKDILPAVRKNPGYLRERNLSVLTPDGQVVNPANVNWQAMTAKRFPYILRQQPGPQNAMGQIKFMFPNEHLIYLHDTPSRNLFEQSERTFSSGCIRVERPLELAEILLAGQSGWDRPAIDKVLESRVTKTVQLAKPVPILIMYLTALAEPDGQVHFYRDVYNRDEALLPALNGEFVMDVPQRRDSGSGE
jgi:murein L,D-transpeptidase YcbB/YkuD